MQLCARSFVIVMICTFQRVRISHLRIIRIRAGLLTSTVICNTLTSKENLLKFVEGSHIRSTSKYVGMTVGPCTQLRSLARARGARGKF